MQYAPWSLLLRHNILPTGLLPTTFLWGIPLTEIRQGLASIRSAVEPILHKFPATFIMAPSPKPDHHLHLNYISQLSASQSKSGSSTTNTSPVDPGPSNPARSPFGNGVNASNMTAPTGSSRLGAGSPSHELGGRLYSKRCVTR